MEAGSFQWRSEIFKDVRNTVDTVIAFTYLPVLSTLQLAQHTYGRENKKKMDHYDPFHLHTYYYDWLIIIYIISLGPTHIRMRFMVWLCLLHVSHLVCGASPSSQITRAATGADGAPNRRHSARPQGISDHTDKAGHHACRHVEFSRA